MENLDFDLSALVRENSASGAFVVQNAARKPGFSDVFNTVVADKQSISNEVEYPTSLAGASESVGDAVMSCDESASPSPTQEAPTMVSIPTQIEDTATAPQTTRPRGRPVGRPRGMSAESVPSVPAVTPVATERPRRAATIRKAEDTDFDDDDNSDDDMSDMACGDHPREIERVRAQLRAKMNDLNSLVQSNKGYSPADRKKLRNRKASCVSRLKKKLFMLELSTQVRDRDQTIADLQARVRACESLLASHGIAIADDARAAAPNVPATPVVAAVLPSPSPPASSRATERSSPVPSGPATPAQPRRGRGRPSKQAKLAERASQLAEEVMDLKRELSVQDGPGVCLCHGAPTSDMLKCLRCNKLYHEMCIGTVTTDPTKFVCLMCS